MIVRTYLELTSPDQLRPAEAPPGAPRLAREALDAPAYRVLYELVGQEYQWRDRNAWSDETLNAHLQREDVALWVLRDVNEGDRPAGFFELQRYPDDSVEIAYFGLAPGYLGRGLGKWFLTRAVQEAWALAPTRVWLHTCTLDNPAALPNYLARGFRVVRTEMLEAKP